MSTLGWIIVSGTLMSALALVGSVTLHWWLGECHVHADIHSEDVNA